MPDSIDRAAVEHTYRTIRTRVRRTPVLDLDSVLLKLEAVGEEAAIDLLLICGWYHAISFLARATRLPREPGTPAFPTAAGA